LRRNILVAGIIVVIIGFAFLILGTGIFETKPQNLDFEPVASAPYPPPIIVTFERNTYDFYVNPIPTPETNHTDNPMIKVYDQSQNLILNSSLLLVGTVYDSASGSTHPNYQCTLHVDSAGVYNITLQGLTGYRVLIWRSPSAAPVVANPYLTAGALGLFVAGALLIGFSFIRKPREQIIINTQKTGAMANKINGKAVYHHSRARFSFSKHASYLEHANRLAIE
jgi:hypothetical protein